MAKKRAKSPKSDTIGKLGLLATKCGVVRSYLAVLFYEENQD
jgi:hypothetical protein